MTNGYNVKNNICDNCNSSLGLLSPFSQNIFKCNLCNGWKANFDLVLDEQLYEFDYFNGDEYLNYNLGTSVHKLNFKRKIELLNSLLGEAKDIRILEIGSATGLFLEEAKLQGWQNVIGIETSNYARNIANKKGLTTFHPNDPLLANTLQLLRPNIIVAWDVWEHLPRPANMILDYLRFASDDVIMAITTVDCESLIAKIRGEKWRQFHPPTHLQYPSKRSLNIFLNANGFQIIKHYYFGYYRPLAEYLSALIPSIKFFRTSAALFKIPLYVNTYDTQIVIGRRSVSNAI